ncbi:MAG: M6 family metalloprotease domain-containing protein [Prevotella sp.]|nr:M6 family metalloprotease domain-containing protein [Prevotella sp.]
MQFRDKHFTKREQDFRLLFNEKNYHEDGAIGSVNDYFYWASYGQLDLQSDIVGPYTTAREMAYYGGNSGIGSGDKNPFGMFEEAIEAAIQEVNLSEYDGDGDGYVDNIHIIYAGHGEEAGASANAIWAHEMTFQTITVQGMKINKYSCAPELRGNLGTGISRIGPHCHEIGHALGAMDYYDTNYQSGGSYSGTGQWDIMATGSWNNDGITPADFNPYVKVYNFGWTEGQSLTTNETNTIGPSSQEGNIYQLDTSVKGDFFLLENRDGTSFNAAEPGHGLLIFHIGPQLEAKAMSNTINATYPQQCYVVCASSTYMRPSASSNTYGDINSAGCPYPGTYRKRAFSDTTTPAALTVSGQTTGISLTDITLNGSDITLFCGGSDSPGSEPEPEQATHFWNEDFERLRIPSSWSYKDVTGQGEFSVVTKLSHGDTPQSPEAASGDGYLKYNAIPQNVMGRYRTEGLLTTAKIALKADKKYCISIKARRFTKTESARDMLTLCLIDETDEIIAKPLMKAVSLQKQWEEFTTFLPDGSYDFKIGILCDIDYGTTLFIDDIRIVEYATDSNINGVFSSPSYVTGQFSLSGLPLCSSHKGLSIIRQSNGKVQKVIGK